jgi:hypothetical protein
MAVLSSLLQREETRGLFQNIDPFSQKKHKRPMKALIRELEGWTFSLRYFWGVRGTIQYGIVARRTLEQEKVSTQLRGNRGGRRVSKPHAQDLVPGGSENHKSGYFNSFSKGHLATRVGFLAIICGYLALILYYKLTRLDTPFESFMDNQGFGVRLLFTGLGQIISFFWQQEFSCKYYSFPARNSFPLRYCIPSRTHWEIHEYDIIRLFFFTDWHL